MGDRCIALYKLKISAEFELGGHSPPGDAHPKNVAFGYDVGKISAGYLVSKLFQPWSTSV